MSLSVHLNTMTSKEFKSGVQHHQERLNEEEAEQVKGSTSSLIDPTQSHMNVNFFKADCLDGVTAKQFVTRELEEVNRIRKDSGGKRLYGSANVVAVGTFQISDESLKLLGYDKSKPASENSEEAIEYVTAVYGYMVQNAIDKPELYGNLLTATLHFDESTPHVDFITTTVDRTKPEWKMRDIVNGPKGYPKGKKLRELQDDLNTIFSDELKQDYGLTRGVPESKKRDRLHQTIKNEKQLKEWELDYKKRSKRLDEREGRLNARERDLEEKEGYLSVKQNNLLKIESEASERVLRLREEEERLNSELEEKRSNARVIRYLRTHKSNNLPGLTMFDSFNQKALKEERNKGVERGLEF